MNILSWSISAKIRGLIKFSFFIFVGINSTSYSQEITLKSLLNEMISFDAAARWPQPEYTLKQTSSYDRKSVSPDKPGWFANNDCSQFYGVELHGKSKEYIMFDAAGPGVIVRFWLTTNVKPGTMRLYFDNEPTASIQIQAYDLMKAGFDLGPGLLNPHSSYTPDGIGGNTLYLPMPYQKHCKITWEDCDTLHTQQSKYYQVNYRSYPPGTKIKTFRKEDIVLNKALIDKVEYSLWNPETCSNGKP